jgi:hypothetical protein
MNDQAIAIGKVFLSGLQLRDTPYSAYKETLVFSFRGVDLY